MCEEVPIDRIADEVGTPFYLYSHATLTHHFRVFDQAFADIPHLICFALEANSNLAALKLFTDLGGGADVVSGGELYRALKAGVPPRLGPQLPRGREAGLRPMVLASHP
jgi:diaminopimelate decarboxylase